MQWVLFAIVNALFVIALENLSLCVVFKDLILFDLCIIILFILSLIT